MRGFALAKTGSKELTKDDQFLFRWNGRQVLTSIHHPCSADRHAKNKRQIWRCLAKNQPIFQKTIGSC